MYKMDGDEKNLKFRGIRGKDVKDFDHIVECLTTTWISVFGLKNLRKPHSTKQIIRTLRWIFLTASMTGTKHVAQLLKKWSGDARANLILEKKVKMEPAAIRTLLLNKSIYPDGLKTAMGQLSYIGRSLPMADKRDVEDALSQHTETLMNTTEVHDETIKCISRFSVSYANRILKRVRISDTKSPGHTKQGIDESNTKLICLQAKEKMKSDAAEYGLKSLYLEDDTALYVSKDPGDIKVSLPDLPHGIGATMTATRKQGGLLHDIATIAMHTSFMEPVDEMVEDERTKLMTPILNGTPAPVPRELVFHTNDCISPTGEALSYPGELAAMNNAGTWDKYVLENRIAKYAIEKCVTAFKEKRIPLIQREVVKEYGLKTRIVTKSPAVLQIAGQIIRRQLLRHFKRIRPIKDVLKGDRHKAIERIVSRGPPATGVFVSTDLSKATDTVSQEAMCELWKEFATAIGYSWRVICIGLLCLGNQVIFDDHNLTEIEPKPEKPESAIDERNFVPNSMFENRTARTGIMMGTPLTWLMLNLSQIWAVETAWYELRREGKTPPEWDQHVRSVRDLEKTYSVCGDDLIAYWPRILAERYEAKLISIGYKTNDKKHYVSKIGGVFTEIMFSGIVGKKDKPYHEKKISKWQSVNRLKLAHLPFNVIAGCKPDPKNPTTHRIIKRDVVVRRLTSYISGIKFSKAFPIKGILSHTSTCERLVSIGQNTKEFLKYSNEERVIDAARYGMRQMIVNLRKEGIIPEAPHSLGGANLWFARTPASRCKGHRRAIAAFAYGLSDLLDGGLLGRCWDVQTPRTGWWAMSEEQARADLMADSNFVIKHPNDITMKSFPKPKKLLELSEDLKKDLGIIGEVTMDNGLLCPADLVITLALEYQFVYSLQMGVDSGGPLEQRGLKAVTRSIRNRIKDLINEWPSAKPVNDLVKAERVLNEKVNSVIAYPAVASWVPSHTPNQKPALAGWHTPCSRRAVYMSLGWNELLIRGKSTLAKQG